MVGWVKVDWIIDEQLHKRVDGLEERMRVFLNISLATPRDPPSFTI